MNKSRGKCCRWCGGALEGRQSRFCSDEHRFAWHKNQRIAPGQLDAKIAAMVEIKCRELVPAMVRSLLAQQGIEPEKLAWPLHSDP